MLLAIRKLLAARSVDEDSRRKEFILNVLLSAAIVLFAIAILVSAIASFAHPESYKQNSVSILILFAILAFFIFLYNLSRRGLFNVASYIFLGTLFLFTAFMGYKWGVDLPASILFYSLLVVTSGILISTRFAFLTTAIVCTTIVIIGNLHNFNILQVSRDWSNELWVGTDIAMASVLFFVIATVSWLSNREIENSLIRARKSEAELKDERDSLEIKVEQRTKELKEVQAEKMTQLYRFAEFGRISSGVFHDLINPLNAVSLNLSKVDVTERGEADLPIEETKQYVNNAVRAAKKLEDLVVAVRKQLAREETRTLFFIDDEIRHVIGVLSHKAQKANVELRFIPCQPSKGTINNLQIFGDAIKFNQVVLNLVANGIDACVEVVPANQYNRWVKISVMEEPETILMMVEDNGAGILEHHMDRIFEPFFTTKTNGQGIGIGLSMAKRIVEKDFRGLLTTKSEVGKGSIFDVRLPIRNQTAEYAT